MAGYSRVQTDHGGDTRFDRLRHDTSMLWPASSDDRLGRVTVSTPSSYEAVAPSRSTGSGIESDATPRGDGARDGGSERRRRPRLGAVVAARVGTLGRVALNCVVRSGVVLVDGHLRVPRLVVGGRDRESLVVEFHLDSVGVEAREVGEHSDRLVVLDDIDGDLAVSGKPGTRAPRVERRRRASNSRPIRSIRSSISVNRSRRVMLVRIRGGAT